jgi:histidine ammonia-lyase
VTSSAGVGTGRGRARSAGAGKAERGGGKGTVVAVDGSSLSCAGVAAVARQRATVTVTPAAAAAARAAWQVAQEVAARQPVYGRTTGVGANHVVPLSDRDRPEHGFRLLRSHAAGAGPLLAPEVARAMLVVRANQIGAGGSGVDPGLLTVLADAINRGFTPPIPLYGAIGTGDLTALASTALCLLGERDWQNGTGPPPRFAIRASEALGFINSGAATLGDAALACHDLAALLRSAIDVASLSLLAVHGSLEPYAEAVHLARPHPGQQRVARAVRAAFSVGRMPAKRVQDPFGYRTFPQVHGPALDSVEHAGEVIEAELNGSPENPLIDAPGHAVWHNGNFHSAYLGLALDAVRAALFQTAALSVARLGTLVEPAFTGLNAFLAENPASSGVMILEYVAHSAVADIRRFAAPAALGGAVLSRGVEEHAGFATQSARATSDAVAAYRAVLACELLAATRALRMAGRAPAPGGRLRRAFDLSDFALEAGIADRPLDNDLVAAQQVLDDFAMMDTALNQDATESG